MSRNKMDKYEAVESMANVYEEGEIEPGTWAKRCFGNGNPITLELGCGKGEYVTDLACRHPERNFIGVDIKGDRIFYGARHAREEGLVNAVFLRAYIQFLDRMFAPNEINEIWIPFPDPYPSKTKSRKRLSSPFFLDIYRKVLTPHGVIHFKTDADTLFRFTLETLRREKANIHYVTDDLYSDGESPDNAKITTTYERTFLQNDKQIKYVSFSLD